MKVRIRNSEKWERTAVAEVDEDELREWAGIPDGPIPADKVTAFIEADADGGWEFLAALAPDRKGYAGYTFVDFDIYSTQLIEGEGGSDV